MRNESEHEAQLQAILDTAVEAILTIDERGIVQSFNLAAVRMFGYQPSEVLGRNVSLLMPPPYQAEHDGYMAAYLASGHKKIIGIGREVQARRKDGSDFPIHLAVSEVRLDGRRLFTGFIRDLSEPKRLEREFLQAQKMETVGSLAGGIAHDFNNLLMGILACSRIAREERVDGEQARELFEEIGAAASRGIALTRRLLAFSRRQPVQLRPTSLDAVIRENETMLRQLLGEDVELRLELDAAGAHALADEGLIEQVLINLVVNARDAMPAGGRITVRTGERTDAPEVVLEIRDTGTGMTPEVRERIFEPFFSTKGPDKGTGLGLSTVKRIVGELQGSIEVETEPGRGTLFRLRIPRSPAAPAPTPAPAPVRVPAHTCSVLVVEDDHLVRASLRRYLDKRGYSVLVADGPAQALDVATRSSFDVLVTDMIMPGATGSELARRIREKLPACKVVYMSAHPAEVLIEQGRLEPGAAFLEKPFEMTALDALLGEVLGASTEPCVPLDRGPGPEEALQGSNADVVSTLVGNHRRFLAFLEKRLGNRALAEDVLQAAFVKGIEKAGDVREHESAVAWFFRLLRNALADHYRRGQGSLRAAGDLDPRHEPAAPEAETEREICRCILDLAGTLKPEYATALKRVEVEGASVQEFAAEAGITANNAAVRLFRARGALKSRVAATCGTCADHGCLDCSCGNSGGRV